LIVQGRTHGHLTIENDIADGLLEVGGIDLAGFYAALKRFIDRRESPDNKSTMPFTVEYFCQKFKIGKSRFYRLAEMLWQIGMLDIDKDRSGNGWRNIYVVHDYPGYDGPIKKIREGSFKYSKKESEKVQDNSDLGQPYAEKPDFSKHSSSDSGIPAAGIPAMGIPPAECNKKQYKEKTNVVVVEEPLVEECREKNKPELAVAATGSNNNAMAPAVQEIQEQVAAATGGATISRAFAKEISVKYPRDQITAAILDLQRQINDGLELRRGVGSWLRAALVRGYEPDQKPKRASPVRQAGRKKNKIREPDDPEVARKKELIKSLYLS